MVYISPCKVLVVFVSDTSSSIYSVQRDYESLEQKERYLSDKARDLAHKKEKINSQRDILDSQLRKLETEQKKLEIEIDSEQINQILVILQIHQMKYFKIVQVGTGFLI